MQVAEIKIGWKALQKILSTVRKAINTNDPVQGQGISISKTDSGTIISVDKKADDTSSDSNNMMAGQWIPVDVMDANCNKKTIQVWGIDSSQ